MKKTYFNLATALITSLAACSLLGCGQGSSGFSPTPPPALQPNPSAPVSREPSKAAPAPRKSHQIVLENILKDSYGFGLGMTQDQAVQLCRQRGATLPSTRDFAEFAVSQGANGILETAYPNGASEDLENAEIKKMAGREFEPIYSFDSGAKRIAFYFNYHGYKSRATGSGYFRHFWTSDSSPAPLKPRVTSHYYEFMDGYGEIFSQDFDDISGMVLCVR